MPGSMHAAKIAPARTLILTGLVVIAAWSLVPALARGAALTQSAVHPVGGPAVLSSNWAGWVVPSASGKVSDVKGSWVVPKLTCSGTSPHTAYSSIWVGIDGYLPGSTTVEQTGTEADCVSGVAHYEAWYEFYPSAPVGAFKVHAGDTIFAEVKFSGGKFTTNVSDKSLSKWKARTAAASSAQRNSAEWIVEAPTSGSAVLPLANFGTAHLGQKYTSVGSTDYATISGGTHPIGSFSARTSITMHDPNGQTATPSGLLDGGRAFTVKWA